MVDSIFMATARLVDIADADENSLLLRKADSSSKLQAEQVSGTLKVNSKIYSRRYTSNTDAYIGFSDKEDLVGKIFNTMPLVNEATLSYSGFFHLFIKPVEIVQDLGGAIVMNDSRALKFSIEIFINSTVAHWYGIAERQKMLLKLNPLLRPADMQRQNGEGNGVMR